MKPHISNLILLLSFNLSNVFNLSTSSTIHGYDPSRKQFIYSLRHEDLIRRERIFEGRDYHLSKKERVVDNYLQYLKWKVLQDTAVSGNFPPARPVEEVVNEIKSSEIYKLMKIMPKGANLHTHENHQLGKLKLLELFMSSNISSHLYVQHGEHSSHEWKLEVHQKDPVKPGLINVLQNQNNQMFSIGNLAKQQTMIGAMETAPKMSPSDSSSRWRLANKIFGRGSSSLVVDSRMKRNYLKAMYEQGLSEGIYYFETRKSFSRLDRDILLTKELVEEFKKEHPQFIGHRRIYYSKRTDRSETIANNLYDLLKVKISHPDHVIGYDLVGEEDWGSTNFHHIDEFLKYIDFHGISGNVTTHIPWLLHTAESNWIENFHIPSINNYDDVVPRSDNLYSSILLGAKRIGHGIGFWKHPYLMELMRKSETAVEVCVVSNQLLGYTHDLRQHPGQLFHKMEIPIILSPDDPGLFGYDEVTLDWYEAFMGWSGLNLGDLKQFGINSIKYSGMDEEEKTQAIEGVLNVEWRKFINTVFKRACTEESFNEDVVKVKFEKLFPNHGPVDRFSQVHIFGFNFQGALCRRIFCRFGDSIITEGMYASNQHLICRTPSVEILKETDKFVFPVYISWSKETLIHHKEHHDEAESDLRPWIETGFKFEFHNFHTETSTSHFTSTGISTFPITTFLMLLMYTVFILL